MWNSIKYMIDYMQQNLTLNDLATLASLILGIFAVYYTKYQKNQFLLELKKYKEEQEAKNPRINVIEVTCYLAPVNQSSEAKSLFQTVLDWSKLKPKIARVPRTNDFFCRIVFSVTNPDINSIFLRQFECKVEHRCFAHKKYVGIFDTVPISWYLPYLPYLPNEYLRLRTYKEKETVSFQSLIELKSQEKFVWELLIDSRHNLEIDARIYLHKVGLYIDTDKGPYNADFQVTRKYKEDKTHIIRWEFLDERSYRELESMFATD